MIQTKKNEKRWVTADTAEMIGKYTASRVIKTWTEEYINHATGQSETVKRTDLLLDRGELITPALAQTISFWMTEGSIKSVEVTDQCRRAAVERPSAAGLYKAAVMLQGKKKSAMLAAQSVEQAVKVLTDFVELNSEGVFRIDSIAPLADAIVIAEDEAELDDSNKSKKRKIYQLATTVRWHYVDGQEQDLYPEALFMVEAVKKAEAYLYDRQDERRERAASDGEDFHEAEFTVLVEESKIVRYDMIVPEDFSKAYLESPE